MRWPQQRLNKFYLQTQIKRKKNLIPNCILSKGGMDLKKVNFFYCHRKMNN